MSPHLAIVLVVSALVLAVDVAGIGWARARCRWAAVQLAERRAELSRLAARRPATTPENAALIEADVARRERQLATMRDALADNDAAEPRGESPIAPVTRTDAFFELAAFVERMQERAKQQGVGVTSRAARFGFARHAHEAPEAAQVKTILDQRAAAEFILDSLFAAGPQTLVEFQRESPVKLLSQSTAPAASEVKFSGKSAATATRRGETKEGTDDFFELDERVSVRASGYVDTMAFRVVFVGETDVLRTFLTRLAASGRTVLVRDLKVERPETDGEAGKDFPAGAGWLSRPTPTTAVADRSEEAEGGPEPIVVPRPALVTVIVEFVARLHEGPGRPSVRVSQPQRQRGSASPLPARATS